ncbi:MAG: membrane protein of unknown function [Promethearchaeota archaeon]|nr:MAG: membrane protein of unknown function [Candidatus Lokiarchaeota archaeon]
MGQNNDKDELIKLEGKEELKPFGRALKIQVMIIGVLWAADTTFFFFEQNFFNTYIDHVLNLGDLYISLMVSLSAVMGLVMNFVWGIISDNTRSKYGRRRPFMLFALIAGVSMFLFAIAGNYLLCVIIDVVFIGITSNAVSVSQRAIIPDKVDLERRGRANGIIQAVSYAGLIIALAFFLLGNELFGIPTIELLNIDVPASGIFQITDIFGISDLFDTKTVISKEGHIILLTFGGIFYAICGITGFIFLKEPDPSELPPKKKFSEELKELINPEELKKQKEFFKVLVAAAIFQTGIGAVMPLLFLFIFDLGLSTIQLLIAIAIGFGVLFPMVIVIGKLADKFGRKKFLPLIFIIIAIAFILVPFVSTNPVNFLLFVVLIPFILIGLLGVQTIINTWAQDELPLGKRGQFYGVFNIVFTVSQFVGSYVGGFFSVLFGRPFIFVAGAIFFLASIPFFLIVKETLKIEK